MNAASTKSGSLLLRLLDRLAQVRISLDFLAPEGYEDENGFHYGPKPQPAVKKISWPPRD